MSKSTNLIFWITAIYTIISCLICIYRSPSFLWLFLNYFVSYLSSSGHLDDFNLEAEFGTHGSIRRMSGGQKVIDGSVYLSPAVISSNLALSQLVTEDQQKTSAATPSFLLFFLPSFIHSFIHSFIPLFLSTSCNIFFFYLLNSLHISIRRSN